MRGVGFNSDGSGSSPARYGLAALGVVAALAVVSGCSTTRVGEGSIQVENRTPGFTTALQSHLQDDAHDVYISWFPSSNPEEFARASSRGMGCGWISDGCIAGPNLIERTDAKTLVEINSLLPNLPPSGAKVPQHAAVIVTFSVAGNGPCTRVYDRFALPPVVEQLARLTYGRSMPIATE